MDNIQFLDCTLREVALPGYHWGTGVMTGVLDGLCRAGVEIIECGFLKSGVHEPGSSLFYDTKHMDTLVAGVKKRGCRIAALMDYGRFDVSALPPARDTLLDIVRVCFKKHQRDAVLEDMAALGEKGYRVFVQHVDIPSYTDEEIQDFIRRLNPLHPACYCIVDTFGSMYVEDLKRIWALVDRTLDGGIAVGIHAHNNLMMANALAMEMIRCHGSRSLIVDGTLLGAGRGAGNANTEILLHYLTQTQGKQYDLTPIYQTVDTIKPLLEENFQWGYTLPYFQTGITGTHVFIVDYLNTRHPLSSTQRMEVIQMLSPELRKKYDYAYLDQLAALVTAERDQEKEK